MEDSLSKLDTHPCTKDQPVCSCMSSNIVCKKIIFDTKISTLLTNNQSFFLQTPVILYVLDAYNYLVYLAK